MHELFVAAVLGIVEGLTEFLPVSSTGHLILAGRALAFEGHRAGSFEIFIQLGGILAVVVLYLQRFLGFLRFSTQSGEAERESTFRGWQGCLRVGVAVLPALVFGAFFHKHIKALLFKPLPVAVALIVGGVVMIVIERSRFVTTKGVEIDSITLRQSLGIGLIQCVSLWPGVSRSGSTIIGGMVMGLDRRAAAEFSFIVAVPVMLAAVSYDLFKSAATLTSADIPFFAVGFVVSFLTAIIAIRCFIQLLGRWTLAPFGYYRIVLGAAVLLFW